MVQEHECRIFFVYFKQTLLRFLKRPSLHRRRSSLWFDDSNIVVDVVRAPRDPPQQHLPCMHACIHACMNSNEYMGERACGCGFERQDGTAIDDEAQQPQGRMELQLTTRHSSHKFPGR